jgi:hypothetical protein
MERHHSFLFRHAMLEERGRDVKRDGSGEQLRGG